MPLNFAPMHQGVNAFSEPNVLTLIAVTICIIYIPNYPFVASRRVNLAVAVTLMNVKLTRTTVIPIPLVLTMEVVSNVAAKPVSPEMELTVPMWMSVSITMEIAMSMHPVRTLLEAEPAHATSLLLPVSTTLEVTIASLKMDTAPIKNSELMETVLQLDVWILTSVSKEATVVT